MLETFLQCINKYKDNPKQRIIKQSFHPKLLNELQKSIEKDTKISEKSALHFFRDGQLSLKHSVPKTIAQINQLADNENFTYRIQAHHLNSPILSYLKDYFELNLKIQSNANLYVTKKGSQTLKKHRDNYTVLVLQIKGSKKWYFDKEEFTTSPGNYFIIPIGREHYAVSDNSQDSYHISYKIQFPSIFQLLHYSGLNQNIISDYSRLNQKKDLIMANNQIKKLKENPKLLEEGIKEFEKLISIDRLCSLREFRESPQTLDITKELYINLQEIVSLDSEEGVNFKITMPNTSILLKNKDVINIFKDLISLKLSTLSELSSIYHPILAVKTLKKLKNHKILINSI